MGNYWLDSSWITLFSGIWKGEDGKSTFETKLHDLKTYETVFFPVTVVRTLDLTLDLYCFGYSPVVFACEKGNEYSSSVIIITYSVLGLVHILFQNQFSTKRYLVPPFPLVSLRSSSSCLRLLLLLSTLSIFPSVFYPVISFRRHFFRKMWLNQSTYPLFPVRRIFISFFCLCNTSIFVVRSCQLIFLNFLQHHISKFKRWKFFVSLVTEFENACL